MFGERPLRLFENQTVNGNRNNNALFSTVMETYFDIHVVGEACDGVEAVA